MGVCPRLWSDLLYSDVWKKNTACCSLWRETFGYPQVAHGWGCDWNSFLLLKIQVSCTYKTFTQTQISCIFQNMAGRKSKLTSVQKNSKADFVFIILKAFGNFESCKWLDVRRRNVGLMVSMLVHHFGSDWNISTTIGWAFIKFGTDIPSAQRIFFYAIMRLKLVDRWIVIAFGTNCTLRGNWICNIMWSYSLVNPSCQAPRWAHGHTTVVQPIRVLWGTTELYLIEKGAKNSTVGLFSMEKMFCSSVEWLRHEFDLLMDSAFTCSARLFLIWMAEVTNAGNNSTTTSCTVSQSELKRSTCIHLDNLEVDWLLPCLASSDFAAFPEEMTFMSTMLISAVRNDGQNYQNKYE